MPDRTARRGRLSGTADPQVRAPQGRRARDSSSSNSSNNDDELHQDGLGESEDPITTRLHVKKDYFGFAEEDTFSFSLWVEVDGEERRVYRPDDIMVDWKSGYIISEDGKYYTVKMDVKRKTRGKHRRKDTFCDMDVECFIDGVYVYGIHLDQNELQERHRPPCTFNSRQTSSTQNRLFRFGDPVLTEDGNLVNCGKFKRISAKFRRSTARIAIDQEPNRSSSLNSGWKVHPDDEERPFFKLQLGYYSKDMLQSDGIVPLEINIAEGEPGLEEDNPIEIEGDEEEEPPIDPPPAGPKEASDLELAVMAAIEDRRRELAQERRDQELLERLRAGNYIAGHDEASKLTGLKRWGSENTTGRAEAKRCKVVVKEE